MSYVAVIGWAWRDFKTGVYSETIVWSDDRFATREIGETVMYARDNMGIGLR